MEILGRYFFLFHKDFWTFLTVSESFQELKALFSASPIYFLHRIAIGRIQKRYEQCIQFRSNLMKRFMSALSSLPRLPQELAIRNLQNVKLIDPAVVAMVARILGSLRSLQLNIANVLEEGNNENDALLPLSWLKPAASDLRHLTLYSSTPFGFYPKLDLREIHFPQPKTLSFGNHTFVHDSQLDWILSHSATLVELYLGNCPILFEVAIDDKRENLCTPRRISNPKLRNLIESDIYYASYEKLWHDYFRSFKNGFPLLRNFRYGHSPDWWSVNETTFFENETQIPIGMTGEAYIIFLEGYGGGPYMEHMIYEAESGAEHRESLELRRRMRRH